MSAKRIVSWILVVLWAAVIFWASAHSGLDLDEGTGPLSVVKRWLAEVLSAAMGRPVDPSPIGHFGEYLVFGALLVNALRQSVTPPRAAWIAVAIAAAYAATDEFHQLFVPGRDCNPADWLVDTTAVALVALVFVIVSTRRRRARNTRDRMGASSSDVV